MMAILARFSARDWPRASQRAPPADQVDQNHDDGHHQKNMDKTTHGVGSDEPEEPQDDAEQLRSCKAWNPPLFNDVVSSAGWLTRRAVPARSRRRATFAKHNRRTVQCASRLDDSLDDSPLAVCSAAHTALVGWKDQRRSARSFPRVAPKTTDLGVCANEQTTFVVANILATNLLPATHFAFRSGVSESWRPAKRWR